MALSMVLATGATTLPVTAYAAEVPTENVVDVEAEMDQQDESVVDETPEVAPDASTSETQSPDVEPELPIPEVKPEIPAPEPVPEVKPETPAPQPTPEVKPETPAPQQTPEVKPETPAPQPAPETPTVQTTPDPTPVVRPNRQPNFNPSVMVQKDNMRFKKVDKVHAFTKSKVEFKESADEKARTVGTLDINGVCFILKAEGDWYFVESGDARGFIKKDELLSEHDSKGMMKVYQDAKGYDGTVESVAPVGKATVSREENKAYYFTKTTVSNPVIEKKYALSTASLLNVREGKGTDSRIVGQLPWNTLCYQIADSDQEWIYVESGDVRGFVHRDYLTVGDQVNQMVAERGENAFAKANQMVKPEENKAWFYTTTSVVEGTENTDASALRKEIVSYASQYLGNPYVWGGTDPVNGADCSGFVQSIYRDFGVQLPRVAEDQAYAGRQIPVDQAQPGDLIFYMDSTGYIYHVVMYAGNGTTVEAMSSEYGITTGRVMSDACWAVSLLDDTAEVETIDAKADLPIVEVGDFEVAFAK